jgi:hypothetical protein
VETNGWIGYQNTIAAGRHVPDMGVLLSICVAFVDNADR